jgi:hypothetical protein
MGVTLSYNGLGGKLKFSGNSGRFKTIYIKPLLLDTYSGAAVAYSLRKLSNIYTGSAIRVLNSAASALDIGFNSNGELDTTSLLTHCGSGNGSISVWYDQSGNNNNATYIPAVNQPPRIVTSGVLQTQNSKPCLNFIASSDHWLQITTPISANTNISIFMTAKGDSLVTNGPMIGGSGAPTTFFGYFASSIGSDYAYGGGLNGSYNFVRTTPNYANTNYLIYNCVVNSSNYYIYQNNINFSFVLNSAALSPTTFERIGAYATYRSTAKFSEIIIYKTDQTTNRDAIVSNTNSYYSIY